MLVSTGFTTAPIPFTLCVPAVAFREKLPFPTLCASPLASMTRTDEGDASQSVVLVTSAVVPSVYVAVAVNCCVLPRGIKGNEGATTTDAIACTPTVNVAFAVMEPEIAVTVVVPIASACTCPEGSSTAPIRAGEVVHVTELLTSCVLPSVYVPIAVNFLLPPNGAEVELGVTAMLVMTAAPPVNVTLADFPDLVAVIVTVPVPTNVARPSEFTEATAGFEELHVTVSVTFSVSPFASVAKLESFTVWPLGIVSPLETPAGRVCVIFVIALTSGLVVAPVPTPQPTESRAKKITKVRVSKGVRLVDTNI